MKPFSHLSCRSGPGGHFEHKPFQGKTGYYVALQHVPSTGHILYEPVCGGDANKLGLGLHLLDPVDVNDMVGGAGGAEGKVHPPQLAEGEDVSDPGPVTIEGASKGVGEPETSPEVGLSEIDLLVEGAKLSFEDRFVLHGGDGPTGAAAGESGYQCSLLFADAVIGGQHVLEGGRKAWA